MSANDRGVKHCRDGEMEFMARQKGGEIQSCKDKEIKG